MGGEASTDHATRLDDLLAEGRRIVAEIGRIPSPEAQGALAELRSSIHVAESRIAGAVDGAGAGAAHPDNINDPFAGEG